MTPAPPLTRPAVHQDPATRPLVVTESPPLLDELVRLAAAADVTVNAVGDVRSVRRHWPHAATVLVGADRAAACVAARLPYRADVALVSDCPTDPGVWQAAVDLGAEHVVFLPAAERWLIDLLARPAPPAPPATGTGTGTGPRTTTSTTTRPGTTVIGMVGGRGGAGATCLAVATAICGLRRGLPTVLVDADPLGGGIDLAVGPGTRADGVRTAYVVVGREAPRPEALAAGPPVPDLPVLSWAGAAVPAAGPETLRALLRDARSRADLVVLDLPRSGPAETSAAAGECDVALLVVPAEVRAVTAARRVASAVIATCADVRVVVRAPGPGGLSAQTVADALGVALGGVLPDEPGLDAALERGHPPGSRGSDALALFGDALLTGLGIRTGTGR